MPPALKPLDERQILGKSIFLFDGVDRARLSALTSMGMVVGEMTARRAGVVINNIRIGELTAQMGPEQLAQVGAGIDVPLFGLSMMIAVVLAFVLFFYLLGALYDDRRDRGVLFWKSLPISYTAAVLSKAAAAMLVAPVLAVGAAMIAAAIWLRRWRDDT